MSAVLPSDVSAPLPHASHRQTCGADARSNVRADVRSRRRGLGAAAVAAGVLAQGTALAWAGDADVTALGLSALAAAVCAAVWMRRRTGHADLLAATVAFGGVGMMVGEWIARAATHTAAHHHGMHHAAMSGGGRSLASWAIATGVMLIGCAAACRWSHAPLCRGGWRRRTVAHLMVAAGMVGGMAAADVLASAFLASASRPAAGMHAAMVLGMAAGVALVLPRVARLDSGRFSAAFPPA